MLNSIAASSQSVPIENLISSKIFNLKSSIAKGTPRR